MTNPVAPRLDTFTVSGAAFLDLGRPDLIKFISSPRNTLRDPSEAVVLEVPAPIVLRQPK